MLEAEAQGLEMLDCKLIIVWKESVLFGLSSLT